MKRAVSPEAADLAEDHWSMSILFQRLSEGLADGLDQRVLATILEALAILAAEHVEREEAWLARTGVADLERHRQEHARTLAELDALLARCRAGRPLTRPDVTAVSALFTDVLFAGDRRDGVMAAM